LAVAALLTLALAPAASAISNFQAFLTMEQGSPSLAIGAAQITYDELTGRVTIDTTALGLDGTLSALPYTMVIPGMAIYLGDSGDWISLSGAMRGMGSHLDLDPCAGAAIRARCIEIFESGLMSKEGGYLNLETDEGEGNIRGFLTFVPEPGTGVLAGLGLAGLAVFGRARRR
jgi:hypothetical protein